MNKVTLLPADIYQVVNKCLITEHDKYILTMLYMPIIGNVAVTLYLTLFNELKASSYISNELNHHHLMVVMNLNLESIKEARIKLEGIGLLKTYVKEGNVNSYVYELYSPLNAYEFFNHPIFNAVLYNNVGKEEYNRLINYFKIPNINLKDYEDITTSFDNAYKSSNNTNIEVNTLDVVNKNKLKLNYEFDFDFDLLISSLPKRIFNEKTLNKTTKELIRDLSFLYEIDALTMSDLVKASLNEKGFIDKEVLKKNVRKYYQFNNNNRLPSLIFKLQPEYLKSPKGDFSNRGRIIQIFESFSPYMFLKSKYKGSKPTERDMKILETLVMDLKINPAVVNVLIDYVLKSNNNKLVKAHIETIAGQWKRLGIETAKEAMEIAEKEHKKYNKNTHTKKENITPSWFNKNITSSNLSDEEKKEFEELIKEFK